MNHASSDSGYHHIIMHFYKPTVSGAISKYINRAQNVMQADDKIAELKQTFRTQAAATRKQAAYNMPHASDLLASSDIFGQIMLPDGPHLIAGYWPIRTGN